MPQTVLTVIGARPQFIKAAAVSRVLAGRGDVREVLVHTGQHYDENMSDVFFAELGIPAPQHHLGVGSGEHGAQTGKMLESIEKVLLEVKPDWLLVYGDTNSTLAGGLAASKLHVPVAHVEAGLRSFNRRMPEEINRVLVDHLADRLYTPTASAVAHLKAEGILASRIRPVGDVMYDVALFQGARARAQSRVLETLGLADGGYVLATIHRAENTDDALRLDAIFAGLSSLDVPVVLPLHPRTRAALAKAGQLDAIAGKLRIIDPVGYLDMVRLEQGAKLIVTDSGGVQKEAFFHGVPCATLRDETEWVELVDAGWNRLVPPVSAEAVISGLQAALSAGPGADVKPYGDGQAAEAIVSDLLAKS